MALTLTRRRINKSGGASYSAPGLRASIYASPQLFEGDAPETLVIDAPNLATPVDRTAEKEEKARVKAEKKAAREQAKAEKKAAREQAKAEREAAKQAKAEARAAAKAAKAAAAAEVPAAEPVAQ